MQSETWLCYGALAHQSTLLCLCRFYSSVLRHLVSDLVSSPVPYFLFFFPPSLLLDHKATALKSYSKSSVPVVKICVQTFMLWLGYLRGNFWNLEILFLLKKKSLGLSHNTICILCAPDSISLEE